MAMIRKQIHTNKYKSLLIVSVSSLLYSSPLLRSSSSSFPLFLHSSLPLLVHSTPPLLHSSTSHPLHPSSSSPPLLHSTSRLPSLLLSSSSLSRHLSSTPPLLHPSSSSPLFSTGEFLSLAAMDTFLRSVQPEVNDLFVLSLVLINLLAWMDLFITQVTSCFSFRRSENKVYFSTVYWVYNFEAFSFHTYIPYFYSTTFQKYCTFSSNTFI